MMSVEEEDAYWERILKSAPYHGTVEKLRDQADKHGWRQIRAARLLARETAEKAPRAVPESLGRVGNRAYRQVNVKLSEPDFEVLRNLSIARDLAPATVARMLLRQVLLEEAKAA